jgi:tetratricopeptide (TPR) repeat protein
VYFVWHPLTRRNISLFVNNVNSTNVARHFLVRRSAGNYDLAIKKWTEAIDATPGSDREFLKVVYSNRSAAYLKLKQNASALADADQCVELDPNWVKGITRKGDALYAQGMLVSMFMWLCVYVRV